MSDDLKACPFCGEQILAVAKKCKHCGEWLEKSAPPSGVRVAAPAASVPTRPPPPPVAVRFSAPPVIPTVFYLWVGSLPGFVIWSLIVVSGCMRDQLRYALGEVFGKSILMAAFFSVVVSAVVGLVFRGALSLARSRKAAWTIALPFAGVYWVALAFLGGDATEQLLLSCGKYLKDAGVDRLILLAGLAAAGSTALAMWRTRGGSEESVMQAVTGSSHAAPAVSAAPVHLSTSRSELRTPVPAPTAKCPHCGGAIMPDATRCMHCWKKVG